MLRSWDPAGPDQLRVSRGDLVLRFWDEEGGSWAWCALVERSGDAVIALRDGYVPQDRLPPRPVEPALEPDSAPARGRTEDPEQEAPEATEGVASTDLKREPTARSFGTRGPSIQPWP